ncbi:MAG: hypothetical protein D6675_05910 [Gemmatimonadetes bacterium]|nr:MAG: hypothetical protein D6675_05910 [Gemmatimonadota bacterium]
MVTWQRFVLYIGMILVFGSSPLSAQWHVLEDSHFRIEYRPPAEQLAKTVQKTLHRVRLPIVSSIDYRPTAQTRVIICSTEDDFTTVTGGFAPEWGVGVAFPAQNLIVLKSPRITHALERLPTVVAHEYVHIVFGQAVAGKSVPRWFHEGLAMYHAKELGLTETLSLSWVSVTHKLLPLDDISQSFPAETNAARMAYMQSRSTISFIIEQYGEDHLRELVRHIRTTQQFEHAILLTFHYNLDTFEQNWRTYVRGRWNWWTLAANTSFLWLTATMLFLIAYWRKRRQTRQIIKQWESEEDWLGLSDEEYRDIWS